MSTPRGVEHLHEVIADSMRLLRVTPGGFDDPCQFVGSETDEREHRLLIGSCVTVFGSVPDVGACGSQSEAVLMTRR